MPAPYAEGQSVVWMQLEGERLRVTPTTVEEIRQTDAGTWEVKTGLGTATVQEGRETPQLEAVDAEMAEALLSHPYGYLVNEDNELTFESSLDQSLEQSIEDNRGWER